MFHIYRFNKKFDEDLVKRKEDGNKNGKRLKEEWFSFMDAAVQEKKTSATSTTSTTAQVTEKQKRIEQKSASSLADAIDIGWLDLSKAEFYVTPGGFTGLRYDGKDYNRIILRRALPIKHPDEYISVADKDNKEIGMIRSLLELSEEQRKIVQAELDKRYYCPTVYEVKSVKDKLGYVYFELIIGRDGVKYKKNCAVKDVSKNIRMLDDDKLAIFDVDGNRYIVESLSKLDKKSLKRLEPYLF